MEYLVRNVNIMQKLFCFEKMYTTPKGEHLSYERRVPIKFLRGSCLKGFEKLLIKLDAATQHLP